MKMREFIFECPGCGCVHRPHNQGPRPCWLSKLRRESTHILSPYPDFLRVPFRERKT